MKTKLFFLGLMVLAAAFVGLVVLAATLPSRAKAAPANEEPLTPDDRIKTSVRLKLVDIEIRKLMEFFETSAERMISLQQSADSLRKNPVDNRLGDYEQSLKQTRQSLDDTTSKLFGLEKEKATLLGLLGKKVSEDAAPEGRERMQRTLEKLVEQLTRIEKRLEQIERRR